MSIALLLALPLSPVPPVCPSPVQVARASVPAAPRLVTVAEALRVDVWGEGGTGPLLRDQLVAARALELGLVDRAPLSGEWRLHLPGAPGQARFDMALAELSALEPLGRDGALHDGAALVLRFDRAPSADFAERVRASAGATHVPARVGLAGDRLWLDPRVTRLDALRSATVAERDLRDWSAFGPALQVAAGGLELAFETGSELAAGADTTPPQPVAAQPITVTGVARPRPGLLQLDVAFPPSSCGFPVEPGHLLELPGGLLLSVVGGGPNPLAVVLEGDVAALVLPATGSHEALWTPGGSVSVDCLLTISPLPGAPPTAGLEPASVFELRFDEPLAPDSVRPFDTFFVTREGATEPFGPEAFVVGSAVGSADLTRWTFVPALELAHSAGQAETYRVHFDAGLADQAGNALGTGGVVAVQLDPSAPTAATGGFALRFEALDEDGDGLDETRGQLVLRSGRAVGRSVTRFSAAADESQAVPSLMVPFAAGIQGPLNPLGSRTQSTWRTVDLGLGLTDEATTNLDVEGLSWAPAGGQVISDVFPTFEILLAHSAKAPDESVKPATLLPRYPQSGISGGTFLDNVLTDPLAPLTVVHPREKGYAISPADLYAGVSGKTLMPFPWNADGDPGDDVTYTWRDTAVLAVAGEGGVGIAPRIAFDAGVGEGPAAGALAAAGEVPSVGLPLLMEFRTFPSDTSHGLNALSIALAINSSALPAFRAHSSGGYNTAGQPVLVNPDVQFHPSGGFNPGSAPPGQPTQPWDNLFFPGQADFVVRVSRAHTRWFDTGSASPSFHAPTLEPLSQPAGTEVQVAWRGASQVGLGGFDAALLDAYGDVPAPGTVPGGFGPPALKNPGIQFSTVPTDWVEDVAGLDGSRFVQARLAFVSDTASGARSALDSLGLVWSAP